MEHYTGIDIGNKYAKLVGKGILAGENFMDQLIISWKQINKKEYESDEKVDGIEKIKYKDKYYRVGLGGVKGIVSPNKGDEESKEMANMFKLIMLARYLRKLGNAEGIFKVLTGVPYDDYENYYSQYLELFKSADDEFEIIEMNGTEYKIKVENAEVTKQGSCVIYTLPNRKTETYLIWDYGGGTLDVSYYINGVRKDGITKNFSLNHLYEEFAKQLRNDGFDIERPNKHNSDFIKDMEKIKIHGDYAGITEIKIDDKIISLKDYADKWFQTPLDDVVAEVIDYLEITKAKMHQAKQVFVGGGAKIFKEQIDNNKQIPGGFTEAKAAEFRNAIAYYELAKVIKTWK